MLVLKLNGFDMSPTTISSTPTLKPRRCFPPIVSVPVSGRSPDPALPRCFGRGDVCGNQLEGGAHLVAIERLPPTQFSLGPRSRDAVAGTSEISRRSKCATASNTWRISSPAADVGVNLPLQEEVASFVCTGSRLGPASTCSADDGKAPPCPSTSPASRHAATPPPSLRGRASRAISGCRRRGCRG